MNEQRYKKWMAFWDKHEPLKKAAVVCEQAAVVSVYAAFILFLLILAVKKNPFAWQTALICGLSFIVLSLVRAKLDCRRPYEIYGTPPALEKDKQGGSFPSRHVFSAAIISVCFFKVSPLLGGCFLGITLLIALLRVLLGVHFVKDVAAGAAVGLFLGGLGILIVSLLPASA